MLARLLAEQRRRQKPEKAHAAVRLQEVEQEIQNIMHAIKAGVLTVTTKAELEKAEAERARLRQTVQGQSKLLDKVGAFLPNLTERFKKVVDELGVVTQSQVDKARGILRELVGGQILLHPATDGVERFLMAELSGDYTGLVRLAGGHRLNMVAVTRIERVTRGL